MKKEKEGQIENIYTITLPNNNWFGCYDSWDNLWKAIDEHFVIVPNYTKGLFDKLPVYSVLENNSWGYKTPRYTCLLKKEDIQSLNFVKCVTDNYLIPDTWYIDYYNIAEGTFVSKEDNDLIKELLSNYQTAYSVNGMDWPYFFKIKDKYITSRTSSWPRYLFEQFQYFNEDFIHPYKAYDTADKHKQDSLGSSYYTAKKINIE